MGFPDCLIGKEFTCNAGDPSSIPGSGRSVGEGIGYPLQCSWVSLVAQLVKNLPAMRETLVQSQDWEDPMEKRKATPSSWFWPGEFHGLSSSWGCKELDKTEWLSLHFTFHSLCIHPLITTDFGAIQATLSQESKSESYTPSSWSFNSMLAYLLILGYIKHHIIFCIKR